MRKFIGIDISEDRGCAVAAIDGSGRSLGSTWSRCDVDDVVREVRLLGNGSGELTIGIDSPRMPSETSRAWYWSRRALGWRPRLTGERGWGRHCEVVIAALRLANPQWTPPGDAAPGWMRFGFSLFRALEGSGEVLEVFPSASYTQLNESDEPRLEISFRAFAPGPKDMLDAFLGAVTVLEYKKGNGSEVGGGDGLGSIVLPRPIVGAPASLLTWPSQVMSSNSALPEVGLG
jgi:predicted nuclease with RNAse H fold